MCAPHWSHVDPTTQREVYRTVKLRGRCVDASWAPWWRAAHRAIAQAMRVAYPTEPEHVEKWLAKALAFADTLEKDRE